MITNEANNLILQSVLNTTLNNINVISINTSSGEIFRKIPTDVELVGSKKKVFTFWLNENEGNGNIVSISLYGNGASTILGTGTEMANQVLALTKNNTQSLLIEWTVEVV